MIFAKNINDLLIRVKIEGLKLINSRFNHTDSLENIQFLEDIPNEVRYPKILIISDKSRGDLFWRLAYNIIYGIDNNTRVQIYNLPSILKTRFKESSSSVPVGRKLPKHSNAMLFIRQNTYIKNVLISSNSPSIFIDSRNRHFLHHYVDETYVDNVECNSINDVVNMISKDYDVNKMIFKINKCSLLDRIDYFYLQSTTFPKNMDFIFDNVRGDLKSRDASTFLIFKKFYDRYRIKTELGFDLLL